MTRPIDVSAAALTGGFAIPPHPDPAEDGGSRPRPAALPPAVAVGLVGSATALLAAAIAASVVVLNANGLPPAPPPPPPPSDRGHAVEDDRPRPPAVVDH